MSDFTKSRISRSDNFATPQGLYDALNTEFHFDDDPSPPPAEVPAFKNWGDFCTVTTGYSVLGSAVLKRGNFKKWEDTNFRDAWALFLEIWTERKNAQRLPGV